MRIRDIISTYEKAREEKEREEERERNRKIQKTLLNAELIENFIMKMAEPVFREAEKDINTMGYPCDVRLVLKRPCTLPDNYREYVVEIRLMAKNQKTGICEESFLTYEGNSENQTLMKEIKIGTNGPPTRSQPFHSSSKDLEGVKGDVEGFVGQVFSL